MNVRRSAVSASLLALALVLPGAASHAGQQIGGMGPGMGMMGYGMGMMGPGMGMMQPGAGMGGAMQGAGMMGPCPGWQAGMGMMGPGMGMMGPGAGVMGPGAGMMGPGMGMMGGWPIDDFSDEDLDRIASRIEDFHDRMRRIAETKDPSSRRALVKEHLQAMQELAHERRKMMMERAARGWDDGTWHRHMEQRMQRMEQMMRRQSDQ